LTLSLAGKHVIVTGASRGIGAATAVALGRAGACVSLTARNEQLTAEVARQIAADGGRATSIPCDVSNYPAVAKMVEGARREFGRIDVVINNAGVVEPIGAIAESEPSEWARNIAINLLGAYHVIRSVLPEMLMTGAGTIINVSSAAAVHPLEGWSAYCSAKAGLAMLTQTLALEADGSGVRSFGFNPGTTDTDMQTVVRASGINRVSRIPREALTPVHVPARALVYLCTPAADDLSGTAVSLNDPNFRGRIGLS
jgi:3-oxoacyl-[acyl-carrier protein] reductase